MLRCVLFLLAKSLWFRFALLALVALAFPGPVKASPRGDAKHRLAIAALKEARFAKARKLWIQAYVIDHAPKYLYNIARMSQELDRPVEALEYFEKFVREVEGQAKFARQVQRAKVLIARLSKEIARLTVSTEQSGTTIIVDEKTVGQGPLRETLQLRAGTHVITASQKGHYGQTRRVQLKEGERREVVIVLKKIKAKVKVVDRPMRVVYPLPRWLPWTAFGLGVAIAAGGGGALWYAYVKYKAYDDSVSRGQTDPHLKDLGDAGKKAGIGLLVAGGIVAVAGVVAIIVNRAKTRKVPIGPPVRPSVSRVEVTPLIGPTSAGLRVRF